MKTMLKALICTALCCAAWSAFAGPPPPKDTITVTALTSTNGVNPSLAGNHSVYHICVPSGGTLSDTLPVRFQGTDNNGTADSTTVSFNVVGADLGVTAPGNFMMSDTDDVTKPITLSKTGLLDGTYNANVQVNVSGNFTTDPNNTLIQIVKNARGKVAATNPGQFYYNMLVPTNTTGTDQTVSVTLGANGLSPQGA